MEQSGNRQQDSRTATVPVRRQIKLVCASPTESLIFRALAGTVPAAAACYEQALTDLAGTRRRSYRGVAHELREALRETFKHLAPDAEVMAAAGFTLEGEMTKPTQRQRALYVFQKRQRSNDGASAGELAINLVEELSAKMTRTAYALGAKDAHTVSSAAEVRQLKMWIDAVLGELLDIHGRD